MVQAKPRDSEIELLRLVVMGFIVLHHFIFHGLGQYRYLSFGEAPLLVSSEINYALVVDSFLIAAVDVFILISGYFSIKFKASSFVKLFGIVSFFSMVGFCYYLYNNGLQWGGVGSIFRIIQRGTCIISNRTFWFIQLYFILMFLSGPLNIYIENASKKSMVSTIGLLAFINIYIGWFHGVDFIKDGYNILNFIMLYFVGRYIKIYYNKSLPKTIDAIAYLISSIITAICAVLLFRINRDPYWMFCYNSPFVLTSAISIFMFFSKIHFTSTVVNYLASSCLAIYLMQDGGINFYRQIKDVYLQNGLNAHFAAMIFLFFMASMLIPLVVDKVRLVFFGKAESWITEKLDKLVFKKWIE